MPLLLIAGAVLLISTAPAHSCGRVTIAEMKWASAEFAANVDKIILEKGFGCRVRLLAGDTMPTTASMTSKGQPDIAPELWINAIKATIERAVKAGRLKIAGKILSEGGIDGWWIPAYMLEKHPELTTLSAVLKRPDLFPNPENNSRGALYNCPSGWHCQIITENLARAFKLKAKGFDLVDTGSAAGLDGSLAKAYTRRQAWFGYYWAPTPLSAKYKMVRLKMGVAHDPVEWDRCTGRADCAKPKKNAFTRATVNTVTSAEFAKRAPEAFAYLAKRSWTNALITRYIAFMEKNQAAGDEAAEKFLKSAPDVWTNWLPDHIAKKVKAAL